MLPLPAGVAHDLETHAVGLIARPRGVVVVGPCSAERAGTEALDAVNRLAPDLVIVDAALNSFGWALDMIANHTLLARVFLMAWGNMFDAGYFWHYNELWIGGATAPGEKAWEIETAHYRIRTNKGLEEGVEFGGDAAGQPKVTYVADHFLAHGGDRQDWNTVPLPFIA